MPGFVGTDTKMVQAPWWGEKERAVIRRFGWGDREVFKGAWLRSETGADGKIVRIYDLEQGLARINPLLMLQGVVTWTDKDGEEVPVTDETVRRLDDRDADFLLGEINEFNPARRRSAEEQETFRGGDRDRAEGGEQVAGGVDAGGDLQGDGVELGGVDGDAGARG